VDTELAGELFATVGRFRRQVRRSAGGPAIGTGLPESHAELLRLVGRRPGISVREAAGELGLAPNTASTLVSKLSADGLLLRSVDPDDRRVGRLRLSTEAQTLADASRAARRATLSSALDRLDGTQLADLTRGLEVMTELTRMLQEAQ
jgi:DNA-binding MarR family transcriptional regulator